MVAHRVVDRLANLAMPFAALARENPGDAILFRPQGPLAGAHIARRLDVVDRVARRPRAEDDRLEERVAAQAVGTVDGDARAFTGSVDARDARSTELVGLDAAHRVVHAGQDRDRGVDRVLAGRVERELANLRQALEDLFAAQMA